MEKREECDIYREHIEQKINTNEQRLNNHSERLDKLEQDRATIFTKIENLVDKLSLTNKLLFALITALIGFFFYAVEHAMFK